MPHEFLRDYLTPSTARDPEVLNEEFRPLVVKLNALGEQDFEANCLTVGQSRPNAITLLARSVQELDPRLTTGTTGSPGPYEWPHPVGGTAATVFEVSDSLGWQAIREVTLGTGGDNLWITGWAQYSCGQDEDGDKGPWVFPARMQFAIEIDGTIIDETITGPDQDYSPVPYELSVTDHDFVTWAKKQDYKEWDSRHLEFLQDATGMNPCVRPVRLTFTVPVPEGTHTVRLVVRRALRQYRQGDIPNALADGSVARWIRRDDNAIDQSPNKAYVWNRALYVIRAGNWQSQDTDAVEASNYAPSQYVDQDVVSQSNLTTARLQGARDALNAIKEDDVSRGAFTCKHLPSIVDSIATDTVTGPDTFSTVYTGFENTIGHTVLDTGAVGFDFTDDEGIIVIMANVEVNSIVHNTTAVGQGDFHFAQFKLDVVDSGGTVYPLPCTECMISNEVGYSIYPQLYTDHRSDLTMDDVQEDAPLVWIGTPDDLPVKVFDKVRVRGTVHNIDPGVDNIDVTTGRGHLSIFRIRR